MTKDAAEDLLAEAGLLGRILSIADACEQTGVLQSRIHSELCNNSPTQRWLFTAQHKHLSQAEMGILAGHTLAAEETDEDFFDNIS